MQIGAHGDPGSHLEFNAILGDRAQGVLATGGRIGAIDHFRIDAGLHGVEHVAAGKIDCRGAIEVQVDVGPVARR